MIPVHRKKTVGLALILLASIIAPLASAQESGSSDEGATFEYHTIASLGDSTLGSDPTGYRGPFVSQHAANLMGVEYYEGAVGGDRSWTLIDAGRHTTIAENYGEGTLVTMMIGAWDFIDSDINIVNSDYSFIDRLDENMTIILDVLIEADIDVLVWNLPNMSFLPFLTQIFPPEVHPYFTEASFLWADRLDEIAARYGDNVQIFDLLTVSNDLLQNQSARMISNHEVISPPSMCAKNCVMVDSLHPTSVGQGLLTNYHMQAINEKFPSANGDYPLLTEAELLALADFEEVEEVSEITIEGDVTKACFDWTEANYRQLYLTVINDGENVVIPNYIGFNTEECRQSTHVMYSSDQAINVVSDVTNELTLNHFFEIWGEEFSSAQIMGMGTDDGGALSITLDGVAYEGDWSAVNIDGVISVEIQFQSGQSQVNPEDGMESESTPGFAALIATIGMLGAAIISSRQGRRN